MPRTLAPKELPRAALWTREQVAAFLNVSASSVDRLALVGAIHEPIQLVPGGRKLWRREAIEAYVASLQPRGAVTA